MADQVKVEYDKAQTKQILRAFKAMDDEAVLQSKKMGFEKKLKGGTLNGR